MIIRVTKEKDAYNEWTKEIIYLHKQLLKDNKYGNIYIYIYEVLLYLRSNDKYGNIYIYIYEVLLYLR